MKPTGIQSRIRTQTRIPPLPPAGNIEADLEFELEPRGKILEPFSTSSELEFVLEPSPLSDLPDVEDWTGERP